MRWILESLGARLLLSCFRVKNFGKARFRCPICFYSGPFRDLAPMTGIRLHAQCPKCDSLERHRIQFLAFQRLVDRIPLEKMRMLHFAPESFFQTYFRSCVRSYVTADISMQGVDCHVDIRVLPFADNSFDLVYASHVLEHVDDDHAALREIRRILSPEGVAILPVPVVTKETVEYPEPNPFETHHVRAPGKDYFDRYSKYFPKVELLCSSECPDEYQCWTYENRSGWPSTEMPLRPAMEGERHEDYVPLCFMCSDA